MVAVDRLPISIAVFPLFVPGYGPIRHTMSEDCEVGSPVHVPSSFGCAEERDRRYDQGKSHASTSIHRFSADK